MMHEGTIYFYVGLPNTRSCMYPPGRIAAGPLGLKDVIAELVPRPRRLGRSGLLLPQSSLRPKCPSRGARPGDRRSPSRVLARPRISPTASPENYQNPKPGEPRAPLRLYVTVKRWLQEPDPTKATAHEHYTPMSQAPRLVPAAPSQARGLKTATTEAPHRPATEQTLRLAANQEAGIRASLCSLDRGLRSAPSRRPAGRRYSAAELEPLPTSPHRH
jgi:hypothetical protein